MDFKDIFSIIFLSPFPELYLLYRVALNLLRMGSMNQFWENKTPLINVCCAFKEGLYISVHTHNFSLVGMGV